MMKKFLLLAALIFCPLSGLSQATTGYHRLNQVLARAPQGVSAQVVPYAKVSVTSTATGLAATIYSDPLLTAPINPPLVTADASGNYSYYLPLNYCVSESVSSPGQGFQNMPNICSGSSGLVSSGTINQIAYYPGNGTTLGGENVVSTGQGGTGAITANGAVNNLLAPEVYLSGSASAGTLASKLAAAPANTKIILQSNYSETLTSTATVNAANVTLQCNPGATLTLGANLANGMIVVPAVTADGFTMSGCTLIQNGYTGQLFVIGDVTGATLSSNVTLTGNTITCNSWPTYTPFCIQPLYTVGFHFTWNTVTAGSTPLLMGGTMTAFNLDHNTITVSGNGAETTGLQYWPAAPGIAPIGGHVGWNNITSGGTYANCITGGGYNVLANGYVYGSGDVIEGNNCTLSDDLTLAYSLVIEHGAIVRNNNTYANGHKATTAFELSGAHSLHLIGNNCYQCQNVSYGMWFDADANDNVVQDNHIYGFLRYGISFETNTKRTSSILATEDRNIVTYNVIEFSNDNAFSTGPPRVDYPVAIEFRTDANIYASEIDSNQVSKNDIIGCPNVDFNATSTPTCTTQVNTRGFELGTISAPAGNFSLRGNTWENLAYAYTTCRSLDTGGSCYQSTAGDENFVNVTNTLYPGSTFLTTGLQLVPSSFIVGPETVAGPAVAPNGSFAVGAGGLATNWFQGCDFGSSCSSSWTAGYQTISVTAADGSVVELDSNYRPATGFTVATGQTYLISFYAVNDGTSGMQVQPGIISITGSTDYCTALLPRTTLTGTRGLYSTQCTINSAGGGNLARLRLYTYTPGGPAIGHVTFDSVYVGLDETPPYKPFWSVIVGDDPSGTFTEVCTTAGGVNGDVVSFDANKNCVDSGIVAANVLTTGSTINATEVNGAVLPASKTVVGTNSSNQIVDASGTTLSNSTTGNAATATALAATPTSATGHVMCWKASGVPGYCSTVVDVSGNCTCN
jgi:hypothetical protein